MEPLGSIGAVLQAQRRLDFGESDESLEEENELDSKLSRLLIDKLSICDL